MLLQFTVGNYISFKEPMTLNLNASNDRELTHLNCVNIDNRKVLKSIGLYGANGSGKTSLISAMQFVKDMVKESSRSTNVGDLIGVEPFRLCSTTEEAPSYFELVFINNSLRHRYGFEVNKERIVSEWLYISYSTKESKMFVRLNDEEIELGPKFKDIKKYLNAEGTVRENTLLLSFAAQMGDVIAMDAVRWFNKVHIQDGLKSYSPQQALEILDNANIPNHKMELYSHLKKKLMSFFTNCDTGIKDIILDKEQLNVDDIIEQLPNNIRQRLLNESFENNLVTSISPKTIHMKYDAVGKEIGEVKFELDVESNGSKTLFSLLGLIVQAIQEDGVLFVDEIDTSLHPLVLPRLISFFHKEAHGFAQMIFTTHCTHLLSADIMRRDQIILVEKSSMGVSCITSLGDKKVRKDESLEKNYLNSKYGGVPKIKV